MDEVEDVRVEVPQGDLDDLHERLDRTRWPDREPVGGWSQGVPLDVVRAWCRSWRHEHDWRATEQRLNRVPQVVTEVDGVRVHALHARSARPDATPLVLTHGWPGSFLEFEECLPLLTHPPAGDPAFHVVVPSVPGYGFSARPTTTGWDVHRIARAWCALMTRLGYPRFLAAGSDWGTSISTSIALQHPERLVGLHLVPPLAAPDRGASPRTDAERRALADLDERTATGSAYSEVHRTRPQTLGYGLCDSPAALAAWVGEKLWLWSDRTAGGLRLDQVLDDLSLYWLTATGASSARLYWESIGEVSAWFTSGTGEAVDVPTGCSVFPAEVPRPSRRWAERRFTRIVHWGEPPRGGHFAAWEQPALFAAELRATRRAIG
ncbi:epoxide hydrolase family protein [Cellulomonas shaoxiangyii]|uniref:epoxide hydrolase family protein n=1 Tax=Cellulomonas shaoxiangyii TaxID=2566013 RepID=UPI001FB5A16D|nr:epoxide hydrolase family protein [Cellulomonas shaoxiangyii]